MITHSSRVRAADFSSPWLQSRAREMNLDPSRLHRKTWECAIIAQIYRENVDPLHADHPRCLGFGVGREPLPLWLYNQGADVTATDYPGDNPAWTSTNQHAANLADLGFFDVCAECQGGGYFLGTPTTRCNSCQGSGKLSDKRIQFLPVDMNNIPANLLSGSFDFAWSCGSFEHVGGIEQSLSFFCRQMSCLKPGGIACHTTEFNLDSANSQFRLGWYESTLNTRDLCLFRWQDLTDLAGRLWAQGDYLFPPDLTPSSSESDPSSSASVAAHPADIYVDSHPYTSDYHLNIRIGSTAFKTTSICLIARKGLRP
jgi:hypothetical protein